MSTTMKPYEHIARAEALIQNLDARWDENGKPIGSTAFVGTPVTLTLAQVHLQLAHMKMIGGQRA